MSINSKIFLESLVTAFDGPLVNVSPHIVDQPAIWNFFLQRLLQHEYILPGTLEQLGNDEYSWLVAWPSGGYSDSGVFRNLQYAGSARTINEIPPINLNSEFNSNEVTAVFTNGCRYIVSTEDLENITRMTPRRFAVVEAIPEGRSFDLDITDIHVNEPLYRAIWEINSILTLVKSILPARPKHTMSARLNNIIGDKLTISRRLSKGGKDSEPAPLPEIKGSGRLTYHVATLNGQMLAVAYKVEGRKITRRELIRHLASDLSKMRATMEAIETTVQQTFEEKRLNEHIRQTVYRVRTALGAVWRLYRLAEENKEKMEKYSPQLGDEPITKVLYPIGSDETPVAVWNDYRAWYKLEWNVLFIEAHRRVVSSVTWMNDNVTIEVTFQGHDVKYFVTPLKKLEEEDHEEELKVDDKIILAGQYLVVVETSGQTFTPNSGGDDWESRGGSVSTGSFFRNGNGHGNVNASSTAVNGSNGNGGGGGGGAGPARPQIPLEVVLNWLKVTGVETPRKKRRHPQKEVSQMVRSALR